MDMSWTGDLGYIPHVGLGALAVGAGGRLARNLWDLSQGGDKRLRAPKIQRSTAAIPVEVTPEEAEELRRQGVEVKRVLRKRAEYDASPVQALGYGALGAGGLIGGWSLADHFLDSMRKRQAEKRRDRVRRRIEDLLSDSPSAEDQQVYGQMKRAEQQLLDGELPLEKTAGVKDWLALGGLALGAGGLTSLISGYRKGRGSSKAQARTQALRRLLAGRPIATPTATTVPVLVEAQRAREEEEEEKKPEYRAPAVPVAPVVEVVPEAGSPAQQAQRTEQAVPALSGSWI